MPRQIKVKSANSIYTWLSVAALVIFVFLIFTAVNKLANPNTNVAPQKSEASYPVCDINKDNKVNTLDKDLFEQYYGSKDKKADLNYDGKVDIKDMTIFYACYTPYATRYPTKSPTPNPTSGCIYCTSNNQCPVGQYCAPQRYCRYSCLKAVPACKLPEPFCPTKPPSASFFPSPNPTIKN